MRVLAYDLLERDGHDLRQLPLAERRALLAEVLATLDDTRVVLSPTLDATDWRDAATQRALARERSVEGLMLKRSTSVYEGGRRRGDWWKWKIEPLTIDAVMIYAQLAWPAQHAVHRLHLRGVGRRAAGAGGQGLFGTG